MQSLSSMRWLEWLNGNSGKVPRIATNEALPERLRESYSPKIKNNYENFKSPNLSGKHLLNIQIGGSSGSTMYPQRPGQPECDFYMRKGMCGYGQRCKFHHPVVRSNPSTNHATLQNVKFTLAGLPKREGIIMCPPYLRSGSCKDGANCKYNHPSPREVIAKALQGITSTDSDEEDG